MALTPEQKQAVASWIASGDNLSNVQQKLATQFQVSMTYMDVRFLVDDLNLEIKDPTPPKKSAAAPADDAAADKAGKSPADKKGFIDKMKEKVGLGAAREASADEAEPDVPLEGEEEELPEEELPPGASSVAIEVDKINLIPGALASGTVTFSDGVTGKWIVDQYGRPGFTEVSKPGYRPTPSDAQAFMRQLSSALQRQGY